MAIARSTGAESSVAEDMPPVSSRQSSVGTGAGARLAKWALWRFLVVGTLGYAIDIGVFGLLMLTFGMAAPSANLLAKLAGGSASFALHRVFTFAQARGTLLGQAARYFSLLSANAPVAAALLWVCDLGLDHAGQAKIVSDGLMIAWSYALNRFVVFRPGAS